MSVDDPSAVRPTSRAENGSFEVDCIRLSDKRLRFSLSSIIVILVEQGGIDVYVISMHWNNAPRKAKETRLVHTNGCA